MMNGEKKMINGEKLLEILNEELNSTEYWPGMPGDGIEWVIDVVKKMMEEKQLEREE